MEEEIDDKRKKYWETIPPTIDGMLGGFSCVSNPDIQASSRFLTLFLQDRKNPVGRTRALDCGAGIGRITKYLLVKFFDTVDLVEQNKSFLDTAKDYIGPDAHKVENLFHSGLQDFVPAAGFYDVIWCQWVIGYLKDDDFVLFLQRCKVGLKQNGIIIIKDNLSSNDTDADHSDGSVTRPRAFLLRLFERAHLKVISERKQYKFPKGLYVVKMFALK